MAVKNFLPEGSRDLISEDCYKKEEIKRILEKKMEIWGYEQIITPTLEYYDIFNSHPEGFKQEDMYKFFDNKGKILVLRPDMTIPIARVVSTKLKEYERPIRIRYTSNIYRVNEAFGGKANEITHCGVELIGKETLEGDLEVIFLAINSLKALGLKGFKIELGHMGIITSIFNEIDISEELKEKIAVLIEKKRLGELENILEEISLEESKKEFLKKLPWLFGSEEILKSVKDLEIYSQIKDSIKYLENLLEGIKKLNLKEYVSLDMGMIPKINYYTGVIMRGYVQGVGKYVLQGGRYDNLIKSFGVDNGAIGFAIDIDSLVDVYEIKEKLVEKKLYFSSEKFLKALEKAEELTISGYKVELIPITGDIEIDENEIVL